MKFTVLRDNLLKGIQIVESVISPHVTLPILSNTLLDIFQENLKLVATDLDIGITCTLPIEELEEVGSITIPTKKFADILRELPEGRITIIVKKNNLVIIETKNCQFKLFGLPKEEFPKLPEFKDKQVFKLNQVDLKKMLDLTAFCVPREEMRYILNGILFRLTKNLIELVATDGRRLALYKKEIPLEIEREIKVIIPLKTILELNRNLREGDLSIIFGDNQIFFDLGKITIISRLIEGEFPDYQQVIPPIQEKKLKIGREEFLSSLRRAALLSTQDYPAVKFEVFKDNLVISKSTPDIGESYEEIPISYQGKEMVIGFNPYYLIDVLKNLEIENIDLELTDPEKPAVIRTGDYLYMLMPMKIS
jgi:DNA polymerase-3 subunit beta